MSEIFLIKLTRNIALSHKFYTKKITNNRAIRSLGKTIKSLKISMAMLIFLFFFYLSFGFQNK